MRKIRLDNNTIISIAATVVSICALFISVYQTVLMRQQQNASVWPKLLIDNPNMSGSGIVPFYRVSVRNVGVGPAIIRDVQLTYRGKRFASFDTYAKFVFGMHRVADSLRGYDFSDLLPDEVVPQGERTILFDTYRNPAARYFIDNRKDIRLTISYESIYGEEWQVTYPHRPSD